MEAEFPKLKFRGKTHEVRELLQSLSRAVVLNVAHKSLVSSPQVFII